MPLALTKGKRSLFKQSMTQTNKNTGHRKRLKERFRRAGRDSLLDYELLEMLLFYGKPQVDTKNTAKALIERFGSFQDVFDHPYEDLVDVQGIGENTGTLITLVKACILEYLRPAQKNLPMLNNPEKVLRYIRTEIGGLQKEFFMILCLNSAGGLIHKEIISRGTLDQAAVYPREVMKRALFLNAAALILVHNHPSGNLKPSANDERLTETLSDIGSTLGITVHDHIIVSREQAYSIKLKDWI
ncbi:MAG: DNA repair protein RadC [Thermodesulfobacteriota bacterium]|nr:DNA repair protein RadC [Thermodesulfobacteriota bacterium]